MDEVDKVTIAAMRERLELQRELYELGVPPSSSLNITSSPVQDLRDVFDLMLTDSVENWTTNTARLTALPAAVDGYIASLRLAAQRGNAAPKRQVHGCIAQCEANLGPDGFFARYARDASADGAPLPAALQADLDRARRRRGAGLPAAARLPGRRAARAARRNATRSASSGTARCPGTSWAPRWTRPRPTSGASRSWPGSTELMLQTANEIKYGASIDEAIAILESDPVRRLSGTDALQAWMQERSDAAVAALADTHFDIPEPVRRLECRIAPTNTGVIYYTGPSDDFSRPGRMWWSVPPGSPSSPPGAS